MQRINSINWDQPRVQSQVKFYHDNEGVDDEDELIGNMQSFVRHDTPHPKGNFVFSNFFFFDLKIQLSFDF